MRNIDVFNHIYPANYYVRLMQVAPDYKDIGKRMRGIPMLADLDVRLRVMDAFGEYQQVLSLPTPPIEVFAGPADAGR
jgi:aminocarboxymuconate-semialdehyde decarboxylase